MTIWQSMLLGLVQGMTEFLPISSSGHLVIVPYLLGWDIPPQDAFIFNVLVQVATLVAVIAYFWKDLLLIIRGLYFGIKAKAPLAEANSRLGVFILIATIPAGLIGVLIKEIVEQAFSSPVITAILLFGTAGLLLLAEKVGARNRKLDQMNWMDALWMGFFQALAVFPGISRSGSTITGGMLRNLEREAAARFSLIMSIPIMLAAGLLAILDLFSLSNWSVSLLVFVPGFIVSAVSGYLSIRWLLKYLIRGSLYLFAAYCTLVGVLTLIVSMPR
jgi:undecaprenyl-diphosphatase